MSKIKIAVTAREVYYQFKDFFDKIKDGLSGIEIKEYEKAERNLKEFLKVSDGRIRGERFPTNRKDFDKLVREMGFHNIEEFEEETGAIFDKVKGRIFEMHQNRVFLK